MKLQFFSINALQPELDQDKINDFCSRHRVVSIDKELITQNNPCFWAICITYLDTSTIATVPLQQQLLILITWKKREVGNKAKMGSLYGIYGIRYSGTMIAICMEIPCITHLTPYYVALHIGYIWAECL